MKKGKKERGRTFVLGLAILLALVFILLIVFNFNSNSNRIKLEPETCNLNGVCESGIGEDRHTCPDDCFPPAPTNENVLCLYNSDDADSTEICRYYLEKRPGANSTGLNIPRLAFEDVYGKIADDNGNLYVGYDDGVGNRFFKGKMDELMIFDKALSEEEVMKLYMNQSGETIGDYNIDKTPIGYWNFNEGEGSIVKDNITGGQGNLVNTEWVDGKNGNGLQFNGSSYAEIPDQPGMDNQEEITVSIWVYPTEIELQGSIASKRDAWVLHPDYTENKVTFFMNDGYKWVAAGNSNVPMNINQWNHIVGVYSNLTGDLSIYINGVKQSSKDTKEDLFETMYFSNFKQYVMDPLRNYIDNNPGLDITHLAVAKGIPFRIYSSTSFGGTYSGVVWLSYLRDSEPYILFDGNYYHVYNKNYHFDPEDFRNASTGELTVRFAVSYLTAYSVQDVKVMIDKAVGKFNLSESLWVADKDSSIGSVVDSDIFTNVVKLRNSGIEEKNIFADGTNNPIVLNQPVVSYLSPGDYHAGYGGKNWILNGDYVKFNPSNRSIIGYLVSDNAKTFHGGPEFGHLPEFGSEQSKIADAFTANAFGGTDYSKSFAGGYGHIYEPGRNGAALLANSLIESYSKGMTLGEAGIMPQVLNYYGDTNYFTGKMYPKVFPIVVGDPLMTLDDSSKTLKLTYGVDCISDSDCEKGHCDVEIKLGIKRCHTDGQKCLFGGNMGDDLEIKNGSTYCSLDKKIKFTCIAGEWVETYAGNSFVCNVTRDPISIFPKAMTDGFYDGLKEYYNNSAIANFVLKAGVECITDSDCGNSRYCNLSVDGINKCRDLVCTSFTYGVWGGCNGVGFQSRDILTSSPDGCMIKDVLPVLTQPCTYEPCNASNWEYTLSPETCPVSGEQTQTWTKIGTCSMAGGVAHPISEVISCTYVPLCESGEILDCDSVENGSVSGYKDKCASDGSNWLGDNTCSITCDSGFSRVADTCVNLTIPYKDTMNRTDLRNETSNGRSLFKDSDNKSVIRFSSLINHSKFENISIIRSNLTFEKAFIIVSNLSLGSGESKDLFIERKNSSSNSLCFRDVDGLSSIGDVVNGCIKIFCPGSLGSYTCSIENDSFVLSGLLHSGVIESYAYCGDGQCTNPEGCSSCSLDCGECSSGEKVDENDRNKVGEDDTSEGTRGGGGSGSGSGGGGGGGSGGVNTANKTNATGDNDSFEGNESNVQENINDTPKSEIEGIDLQSILSLFEGVNWVSIGIIGGVVVLVISILVIVKIRKKRRISGAIIENSSNSVIKEKSPVEDSDEREIKEIRGLLFAGNQAIRRGRVDDAREIYKKIKEDYPHLMKKNSQVYEEIMQFFNSLK